MAFIIEYPLEENKDEPAFDFDPLSNGRNDVTINDMMALITHAYDITKRYKFPVSFKYVSGNQIARIEEFNKHSKKETLDRIKDIITLYGISLPLQYPLIVELSEEEKQKAEDQNVGNSGLMYRFWQWIW